MIDVQLLWSTRRMDRERASATAAAAAAEADAEAKAEMLAEVARVLEESCGAVAADEVWERRHGGLLLIATFASRGLLGAEAIGAGAGKATAALTHPEPRVREQAGNTLAALAAAALGVGAPSVYRTHCREAILAGIRDNLERAEDAVEAELEEKLKKRLQPKKPLGVDEILHQSAGWKSLESSCKALLEIAKAVGTEFAPDVTPELLDLITRTLSHTNRFVRETGFQICAELSTLVHECPLDTADVDRAAFDATMSGLVATGLADNWSQVRMAASVAARKFLLSVPAEERAQFYPLFLPPTALNRYYVAEGVRLYNQATWREVVGDGGQQLVEEHIGSIVPFYLSQADAANHAVREAACACIAELGLKVRPEAVAPYVAQMLAVLLECFRDESWPVRDAACIALGRFIQGFPEEARGRLPELYELFFNHVCDNIWSVRENAAVALGAVVQTYGDEAFALVEAKVRELLPAAKEQPAGSKKNANLTNTTTFGVAGSFGWAGDEDAVQFADQAPPASTKRFVPLDKVGPAFSDQQMFSCGSLAPKLKRKGGCMDCGYLRPPEPWERSDGAVYLLRELATGHPEQVAALLPALADLTRVRHFEHHYTLLETVWKQLPTVAAAVGKKRFKPSLEPFLAPLHYSLLCPNQLAQHAARGCVAALAKLLGPSILKGRVEMADPRFVDAFEAAIADGQGGR
eukprot:m.229336 g.229336  ORF g.229336 m.229336 type:complete len:694 (+) comp15680_c1_seq4:36-2117(+)